MSDDLLFTRWEELSPLVDKAQGLEGDQLDEFCSTECGDDTELQTLLRTLLRNTVDSDEKVHESISQLAKDASAGETLIGTTVGAYTLIEELGIGGMGTVYLASRADGEFDKKVAVKIVRRQLPGSAAIAMFRNERQAMANLYHPSIPTLVDAGELEDGRPYFICDFIDGITIDEYCTEKRLSVRKILHLFKNVADAVQHAHTNLILHLDIKPSNILVQQDGTPSLLDFGVARVVGDDSDGSHAYSPSYASPEQILGERLTAASDVYSLGALLFCLLSGERPFTVDHLAPTQTVFAKRAEFIDRLQSDNQLKGIDADLRAIVHKAMSEVPANRYPTVDSLLNDLQRFRQVLPVKARMGGTAYRLGKYGRRHRLGLILATIALITLGGFMTREVDLRKQAQEASFQAQASAKAAQEALVEAAREAETSRQVSNFLVNIFEVSDPGVARGNSVTARELLDRAAQRVDEDLAAQPHVAANLKHTMGSAYVGLGLYEAAVPLLQQALASSASIGDSASLNHAAILYSLGKQYDALARHTEAIDALSASLEIKKEVLGAEHAEVVIDLIAIARLNRLIGHNDKAESLLIEASEIVEQTVGINDSLNGNVLSELSRVYGDDRRDLAFKALEQAVAIKRSNSTDPLDFALSLNDLGTQYQEEGNYKKSMILFQEALDVVNAALPPNHASIGTFHFSIAITHMNTKEFDAAEKSILKAIEIQEAGLGGLHPAVGFSTSVLGEIYQEQGKFLEAEKSMKQALKIVNTSHPEEHLDVNFEKFRLAELYRRMGRLDDALAMINIAVKHYLKIDPATHLNAVDARWTKAKILSDRGQIDDAAELFAKLFKLCESFSNMTDDHIDTISEDYAAFLKTYGEPVDVNELKTRLRPD